MDTKLQLTETLIKKNYLIGPKSNIYFPIYFLFPFFSLIYFMVKVNFATCTKPHFVLTASIENWKR